RRPGTVSAGCGRGEPRGFIGWSPVSAHATANASPRPLRIGLPPVGALLRAAGDTIPPTWMVLIGIVSVQMGAGIAKNLCGVLPLGRSDGDITFTGVAFALLAGVAWAGYILLSAATGRRFAGTSGLAIAAVVGVFVMAPVGIAEGGTALLDPRLLAIGAAV